MSSKVFVCPHCREESDHILYECGVTQYGTESGKYALVRGHDCDDTEFNDSDSDNYEYECPNCNHDIDSRDDYFYDEGSDEYLDAINEDDDDDEEVIDTPWEPDITALTPEEVAKAHAEHAARKKLRAERCYVGKNEKL